MQRRPRVDLIAVIAAMLLGGCATTGQISPAGSAIATIAAPTTAATRAATTRPPPTAAPAAILGSFDVGGDGWSMALAGGALWIQVDPMVNAIVRVDTATGSTLPTARSGRRVKFGPEGLWVVGPDWVARLDPATGSEVQRLPIGGAFAIGDGAVWLVNKTGLHRIDAATGVAADPIPSDPARHCLEWKEMVVAFDRAWLACKEGMVIAIDLQSGATTAIPTAAGAHTFGVLPDSVWVTNYQVGSVSRIDPDTYEVTSVAGAGSGVGITAGDGYVWAAFGSGIAKIDPATATIIGTIDLGRGEYYELVWDAGVIWASTRTSKILKIDSTKLE